MKGIKFKIEIGESKFRNSIEKKELDRNCVNISCDNEDSLYRVLKKCLNPEISEKVKASIQHAKEMAKEIKLSQKGKSLSKKNAYSHYYCLSNVWDYYIVCGVLDYETDTFYADYVEGIA